MGSALGMHVLVAHPTTPSQAVSRVSVQLFLTGHRELRLEYYVSPVHCLALPEAKPAGRADFLWKTTCFELFIQPEGDQRYSEFNFSPSRQWAAYDFSGYRAGGTEQPMNDPEVRTFLGDTDYLLAVGALPELPPRPLRLGLSAVIEEVDGTKSYWALAHPDPSRPDFHRPDGFVLELPGVSSISSLRGA